MANRPCGCGARGRHKPSCSLSTTQKIEGFTEETYTDSYGHPPELVWSFNKGRQATVEKRLKRFVDKKKSFYLTVTKPDESIEHWFIDGGNWTTTQQANGKYYGLLGHINNLLPFIKGRSISLVDFVDQTVSRRRKRKSK